MTETVTPTNIIARQLFLMGLFPRERLIVNANTLRAHFKTGPRMVNIDITLTGRDFYDVRVAQWTDPVDIDVTQHVGVEVTGLWHIFNAAGVA